MIRLYKANKKKKRKRRNRNGGKRWMERREYWVENNIESKEVIWVKLSKGNEKYLFIAVYMNNEKEKQRWIIICRDFNAGSGEKGEIWGEVTDRINRKSRDKVINEEGKEMLEWLKENGLGIVNRTNGIGDFTYLGLRPFTVID